MPARPPGLTFRFSTTRRAPRSTNIPSYGTSQNPVDSTAQGVQKLGYAEFARLVARSPSVDGVIVVITARRSAFLEADLPKLKELKRESTKPVFMWTYTLPSERTVEILNEAGYPLFTGAHGCARTMREMPDYHTLRERMLSAPNITRGAAAGARENPRRACGLALDLCEYRARPLLAAYGIGSENAGRLVHAREEAIDAAQAIGRAGGAQGPVRRYPAQDRSRRRRLASRRSRAVRAAYEHVLAAAKRYAPHAHIDGVLVQPMAPPGREVILGINRDPTWGLLLMVGLGGVLVEALGDVALAPVPLDAATGLALIGRLKGATLFERLSRHAAGGYRGAGRSDGTAVAICVRSCRRYRLEIDLNPVIVHGRAMACPSWMR